MKRTRPKIFIIGLTLLVFSLSTSGQSGTLYHCVNSKGSIFLTDNVPTDPDFKCTFSTSYKDLTPQERAKEQREAEADRQRMRADVEKHEANKQRQEAELFQKRTEEAANKAQEAANKREEREKEGRIAVEKAIRDAKIEYLEKAIKNPGGDHIQNVRDANKKIDRVRDQYR